MSRKVAVVERIVATDLLERTPQQQAEHDVRLRIAAPRLVEALRDLVDAGAEAWGVNRPCVALGRELLRELDAPPVLVDPFHCSCKRYPNGGRRSTDPLCPLHSGDARD